MQKRFIKSASFIIAIAMAITILAVGILQTRSAYATGRVELDYLLDDVSARLIENEEEVAQLTESTSADFHARARAFSLIIQQNPEILDSGAELHRILDELDVDELHVTDGDGFIRWTTVPAYQGFDMASSEQSSAFLPMLTDKSYELAQEPQVNGTVGALFQYVGVARYDEPGIVQIGMQPTRLQSVLERTSIDKALERYDDGEELVFALNPADHTVVWHPDESLIGKSAEEIGLPADLSSLYGGYHLQRIDGQKVYMSAQEMGGYIIVPVYLIDQLMADRNTQMLFLVISDIIVVLVMVAAIRALLSKQIVSPIWDILKKLDNIAEGDLATRVEVRTCPEFSQFSDGINAMVQGIGAKIRETETLLEQQKQISENVMLSAGTLSRLSDGNITTSERLAHGAQAQTASMHALTEYISGLAEQMSKDGQRAAQASESSTASVEMMRQSVEALERLSSAMVELDHMSGEIQQVVKAIDNISFQTNILALNAAVEAARAGAAGKGFAVVADEVRSLAAQSADSAKQTAEMIGNTTALMQEGKALSMQAAEAVQLAMEKASAVKDFTGGIVENAQQQTHTIAQIHSSGQQVSQVIADNAALALESQSGVANLLEEVRRLQALASSGNSGEA